MGQSYLRVALLLKNGVEGAPAHGRYLYTDQPSPAQCIGAIINSSLFYLYFVTYGDCFHLSNTIVHNFPVTGAIMSDPDLASLNRELMRDLHEKAERKTIDTKIDSLVKSLCRSN